MLGSGLLKLGAIAAKGGGLAVLGTAAAGAASQSLALVAAILPATGAIGLLPTVAVSAAAALGVLKLATTGLGDAMKAVASGDAKKFDEAIKNLSPNARALAREVRRLWPELDQLRRRVQDAVFRGMAVQVRALAATWLPILGARLEGIGMAWNVAFRNIAQAARSQVVVQGISAALYTAHLALARLNDQVGPLVRGFGALVGAAAPFIDNFGRGLANLAGRFGTFLQQAAASGRLAAFFQLATQTLEDLGGIALQVGGILREVFSAAASVGGGLLGNLREALSTVNAFLKSTEGQTALRDFFASTSGVLRALLPTLKILATAFGSTLAPAISQVATVLAPVLQVLASGLAQAVAALAPVLPSLADSLGRIVVALVPILPPLGQLVAALVTALLPVVNALVPAISLLATALVPVIGLLTRLAPVIAGIALVIGVLLLPAWVLVGAAIIGLVTLVVRNWDTIKSATLKAWNAVRNFVVGAARSVIGWLKANWPLILAILTGPIGLAVLAIVRNWDRIKSGARAAWNGVIGFLRSIPGRIRSALGNLGGLLVQAGRAVISGLISGIKQSLGPLGSALGAVGSFIASHKGPRSVDLALLHPAGQAIMAGLRAGIAAGLPDLGRQLTGVTDMIGTAGTLAGPAFAGGGTGAGGAAAGGGDHRVVLEFASSGSSEFDRFMMTWLRKNIRVRGGNVQAVLGVSR